MRAQLGTKDKRERENCSWAVVGFCAGQQLRVRASMGKKVTLSQTTTPFFPPPARIFPLAFSRSFVFLAAHRDTRASGDPIRQRRIAKKNRPHQGRNHREKKEGREKPKNPMFPFMAASGWGASPNQSLFDDDAGWFAEDDDPVETMPSLAQQGGLLEAPPAVDGYFWRGAPIDERQRAYCRCLLHVAARNSPECYENRGAALGQGRCYNPYAVCTASVGRQSECSAYYAFTPEAVRGGIPDNEVEAYARLRGLPVGPTRQATVATIYDYLRSRRK